LQIVCTAHAVQYLNHFSRVGVHYNEFARFALVPTSDVASVGDRSAANEQSMMLWIQTGGMRYRAAGDWPLCEHRTFFEIDDGHMTFTVNNISHGHVKSFSRRLDGDTGWIATGELDAAHQFGRGCVDYIDGSIRRSVLA